MISFVHKLFPDNMRLKGADLSQKGVVSSGPSNAKGPTIALDRHSGHSNAILLKGPFTCNNGPHLKQISRDNNPLPTRENKHMPTRQSTVVTGESIDIPALPATQPC